MNAGQNVAELRVLPLDELDDEALDHDLDSEYRERRAEPAQKRLKKLMIVSSSPRSLRHLLALIFQLESLRNSKVSSRLRHREMEEGKLKSQCRTNGSWTCECTRSTGFCIGRVRQGDQRLALVLLL